MENKLKQQIGAEKRRREAASRRKKIKKIIQLPRPILLLIIIGVIAVLYFTTILLDFLGTETAMTSKQANISAIKYSGAATEEDSPNRIIVDVNNRNSDGAYELSYSFKDEEGNEISEIEALEKIKLDLLKENGDLDLSKFSDSELNIIGALMYNGLKVEQYNEEELKALVIFLKADIAGQSFDLRPKDQIGQPVDFSELRDNDLVYGTLQVQRVKIEELDGVLDYKEELLEYIPYGDETTPDTFCYMVKNNDESVLNKFTVNENAELIYAQLSKTDISHTYFLEDGTQLITTEEILGVIPEENIEQDLYEINIVEKKINYKTQITKYTSNYGLLSDLLETTKNVDFCIELAQIALNNKIVININEGLEIRNQRQRATYEITTLVYDYVQYEIEGLDFIYSIRIEPIASGEGNPSDSSILGEYGWNSTLPYSVISQSSQGATWLYEWTHNNLNYKLKYIFGRTGNRWELTGEISERTESILPSESNKQDTEDGELITFPVTHTPAEDNQYTAEEKFKYIIQTDTYTEYHPCSIEIGEVDTWCMKYKKEYNAPIEEELSIPEDYDIFGEFSELIDCGIITDSLLIEEDPHVQQFRTQRILLYRFDHGTNNEPTITFSRLRIKQRVKTDVSVVFEALGPNISYKFGEEIVDTTEVSWKNVIFINNEPQYTSYIDENAAEKTPEIGFLYIYDKYITVGIDLYLQNDSENKLFELLESDPQTANSANIVKYLLFVYDGIDRGVTELKLTIVDLNNLNGVKGSALQNYMKAWENYDLWKYETGQTGVFPSQYLTEDEMNYIVYEDGGNSTGHNNIAYGMATFITNKDNAKVTHPEYGEGYYNWEEYFKTHEVIVQDLYEGAYVNKQIADDVFEKDILPYCIGIMEAELGKEPLSNYKFSQAQKDALTAICYQYGNLLGFAEAYENSLNEEGLLDAEKLAKNYRRLNYTKGDPRKYANWVLFTQETYTDKYGNEIKSLGGDILNVAKAIDNYMAENEYYYCLDGPEKSRNAHRAAGLYDCGLANTFEASQKPGNNGYRLTCCATYVSWVLQELEYIQNHVNGCDDLIVQLEKNSWIEINDYGSLQPGDIVFFDTDSDFSDWSDHVEIFVEVSSSGKYLYYGAGSNEALKDYEPRQEGSEWTFYKAYRKP